MPVLQLENCVLDIQNVLFSSPAGVAKLGCDPDKKRYLSYLYTLYRHDVTGH